MPAEACLVSFVQEVSICACMYVFVCVPPGYSTPVTCNESIITNQTSHMAFLVSLCTLAIDITDEHGLSNKVCHEFLPKKNKVMLNLLFISQ